jgi:hypothetical protein
MSLICVLKGKEWELELCTSVLISMRLQEKVKMTSRNFYHIITGWRNVGSWFFILRRSKTFLLSNASRLGPVPNLSPVHWVLRGDAALAWCWLLTTTLIIHEATGTPPPHCPICRPIYAAVLIEEHKSLHSFHIIIIIYYYYYYCVILRVSLVQARTLWLLVVGFSVRISTNTLTTITRRLSWVSSVHPGRNRFWALNLAVTASSHFLFNSLLAIICLSDAI